MGETIYIVDGKRLTPMRPAAPPDEATLQSLIEDHSDLIGEEDGELLIVKREQSIADTEGGSERWSLDHLFVARDATPVLVEVKRAVDTRLRREVLGQILEYAANGALHWSADLLAQSFRFTHGDDAEDKLSSFLDGDEVAIQRFWNEVEARLRAGEMKLLIVADQISPDLARIIEFLNRQMRCEIFAVELKYYESDSGVLTLVPRAIGRTEEAKAKTGKRTLPDPVSIEEWLTREILPKGREAIAGAHRWMQLMQELGAKLQVASTQGSIVACCIAKDGKPVYPSHLKKSGNAVLSFGWTSNRPALSDESVRAQLFNRLQSAAGPLTSTNLNGSPGVPLEKLSDDLFFTKFSDLMGDYVFLALKSE